MTLTFEAKTYSQLLAEVAPTSIESEAEYERLLGIVEALHFNASLNSDQLKLYKLLVTLIEAYEEENYPMSDVSPKAMLEFLMDSKQLKPADLIGVMGSEEMVERVLRGDRTLDIAQAQALGNYFQIMPSVFL
ncbi:MAG: transcriptional regulator [Spirulina sp. SIO3F2]|nr:transcriptional regulator [Spirulina sp. SIO3F2]